MTLFPVAQQVKDQLEREHPEYFVQRKNGTRTVEVVTSEGKQAFIQAMIAAGVKLKSK